jgi:hypothetical protein
MEEITGQVFSVSFRKASNINHDKTYTPPQMNRVFNSRKSDFKNQIMKIEKERNHSSELDLYDKLPQEF